MCMNSPKVLSSLKSSGFLVYKYFEGLFFKVVSGEKKFEGLKVSPNATKTCLLAGLLFTAQSAQLLDVSASTLMQSMVVLALTLRASSVLLATSDPDPYLPFETATCTAVFGRPDEDACPKDDAKPDKKVSLFLTFLTTTDTLLTQ